ncbi:restriction endonuclease subunit S [Lachnospira eligens]|uniref:restriction endonuclease subunit S n=1 Tax=Lachnospira eligens TaxID=39485 RepID=UPI000E54B1AD|nr:restriction endonuclease subunit S [Lachnospira eligens]RGT55301.1 restriction endonuclease subunit S [Lachnospira eligens]
MKYYKLNDLCTDIVDCPHTTPDWKNEGIRVVRNFNLKDGNLDFTDGYFVDEATYLERTKRAIPEEGDIIISREAPMGVVGIVPKGLKCCLGQRLVLLKVNKGKCDPYYLLNTLMSDFVQTQFKRADATGSIVSNLCIPDLKEIIIPVIESGQEDVARLLEIINKKQLINNAINDNLEQQLMLLYDYWFTQFDFPDNDGNPYQTSGGKVVWNDTLKRNIPENWKVQSVISNCLSSIIKPGVEIFNTKTYLATADVKGTSISTGTIVDYDGRESRANMQPSINSVWFAKMKNSVKHLYLNKEMQPIISSSILSTGFCGLQCNEISFEYIASYVSNAYFEIHKDMLAHGATQEAVNNDDLAGVHIIIPEDTVLRAYHEATQAIYAQISKNICENQELFKLRDWLLPMLMNGQATISD